MSDERLEQLGIPRRRFLTRTAAAAFVAPVVVSFGLDGVAEAHGHHHPNMTCANMTMPNQVAAEQDLVMLIGRIVMDVQSDMLDFGRANSLAEKALHAALQLASGHDNGACAKIDALVNELTRHPTSDPMLLVLATNAQKAAGCGCTPTHHGDGQGGDSQG
jgi:hypothetical protein